MTTTAKFAKGRLMPYPSSLNAREVETNGATLHVRIGGQGPAVMLLHGYGLTGVRGLRWRRRWRKLTP